MIRRNGELVCDGCGGPKPRYRRTDEATDNNPCLYCAKCVERDVAYAGGEAAGPPGSKGGFMNRPTLRLATEAGQPVQRPERPVRPITEQEAYAELVDFVKRTQQRLDPSSDVWREFGYLLVEAEIGRAAGGAA